MVFKAESCDLIQVSVSRVVEEEKGPGTHCTRMRWGPQKNVG